MSTSKSYKRSLTKLAIVLGSLVVSSPAAAAYRVCGTTFADQREAAQKTASFVRTMKIAKAQGDLVGMRSAFDDFYTRFAAACDNGAPPGNELRQVCGYDCHVELAEYHLFLASDLEYYATRGAGGTAELLKPEAMAREVLAGVKIVDSGVEVLRGAGASAGLRDYLRNVGGLNLLRAKLFMAQGDAWYKNVSEKRIARLAYLASTAVDAEPQAAGSGMLDQARAGYDAALWGLNEALLEIPQESYFDSIYLEARFLASELKLRRDSLQKGLIFIGIDPDEYKQIDISTLERRLRESKQEISGLESQIEGVVRTYLSKKDEIAIANQRNELELASQSLGVSTYRVAKMENLAEQQRAALQIALEKVSSARGGFDRERARAEALFSMRQQTDETKSRLMQLEGSKEVDVLSFQRDEVVQRINELQWLMNWEVSKTNLDLQIDSLRSQVLSLQKDATKSALTKTQLVERAAQTRSQIAIASANISASRARISALQARKGPIFEESKRGMAASICELEARLVRLQGPAAVPTPFSWTESGAPKTCDLGLPAALGTREQYIKNRCDMKKKALAARVDTTADLLICVVGTAQLPATVRSSLNDYLGQMSPPTNVDAYGASRCAAVRQNCDSIPNGQGITCNDMYTLSRAAYAERMKLAQQKVAAMNAYKDDLNEFLTWLRAEIGTMTATSAVSDLAGWPVKIAAITAVQTAASAFPKISLGAIAGPTGGAVTLDFSWMTIKEKADDALTTAKLIHEAAQSALDWERFLFTQKAQMNELKNNIDKVKRELSDFNVAKDIQALETAQAIVEITGRSLDLSGQVQNTLAEVKLDQLACTEEQTDLASEVAQLRFRHGSLIAQHRVSQLENDTLQREIESIELSIVNEGHTIDIHNSTIRETDLETQKVQAELDSINGNEARGIIGLEQRTKDQIGKLLALTGRLDQHASDLDRQTSVRNTLSSDIFQTSIKLTSMEIDHVRNLLGGQQSHTAEMIATLDAIDDAELRADGLRASMTQTYKDLQDRIGVERQNMLNTSEQTYQQVAQNGSREIYLSNQELVATLTKGVPQFLQAKRRLMQAANYELALLYTKAKAIHSLVSPNASFGLANDADPIAFAKTAQDLDDALRGMADSAFRDQAIVGAEIVSIEIPFGSGLGRQLQTEQSAEFEITPAASGRMAELGYYGLWHPVFQEAGAFTVIDMGLLVSFLPSGCARRRFELEHAGSGFRFAPTAGGAPEPMFFTSTPRKHLPLIFTHETQLVEFNTSWRRNFSLFGFWQGQVRPSYDPETLLPLLGTPVIGTYRVRLPRAVDEIASGSGSTCTYKDAPMRLVIAYSKVH